MWARGLRRGAGPYSHRVWVSPALSQHSVGCRNIEVISGQQKSSDVVETAEVTANWKWVPPRARRSNGEEPELDGDKVLPVLKGSYLTVDDITKLLNYYKGVDVVSIPIGHDKIMDGIEFFILVSGDSSRHIRRMADAVLKQVRKRKLIKAAAFKNGVEGDKVDDWLVIDCHNCVVHCMLPETRKNLDLESHWGKECRPYAMNTGSDKEYENSLDKLFNQYPPPLEDSPSVFNDSKFKYN